MCGHGEHHRHHDCGCESERPEAERCDCGCHERPAPPHRHHHGSDCCCTAHASPWDRERAFWRRFASREERIAWLERYLQDLRAEAQAVEERIAEMRTP